MDHLIASNPECPYSDSVAVVVVVTNTTSSI